MGVPSTLDQSLSHRLAAAGASAELETEAGIQRARGWILVVSLLQTALLPGRFWYLAWGAMAVLALTWVWVHWMLRGRLGRSALHRVGVVAMAADAVAAVMIMANLMDRPTDPVQLLPLALALEAAYRWGRAGGIIGGIAGGLLITGWSYGTHVRSGVDFVVGYAIFRLGVVALVGAFVGNAIRESRQQRRAAEAVFHASRDLMATFSMDGTLRSVNPACEWILGYTSEELMTQDRSFLRAVDGNDTGLEGSWNPQGAERVVRQVLHRDGHLVWIELDLVPDAEAGLVYAIGRDVSDRSRAESELRHRADHDGLTGAWNRHTLVGYLERMLGRKYLPAVVFIDIDQFKEINDLHGHLAGDLVIVEVARRLAPAAGESGSVARYAGDEFCIVVDDVDDLDLVADRTREVFLTPIELADGSIVVSASVGLACSRPDDTPASLLARADEAMYEVKELGRLAL